MGTETSTTSTETLTAPRESIGAPLVRLDGPAKVAGTAPYAYEHPVKAPTFLHSVHSTIVRGRVTAIDTSAAEAVNGVLRVLTHENAPRLADTSDRELAVLQSDEIAFRGQYVAAVIAESPEAARHAAGLVHVTYEEQPGEVELTEGGDVSTPIDQGDVEAAISSAAVTVDQSYTTPMQHNNPMEPHTTVARWSATGSAGGGILTLHDSTQGPHQARQMLAPVLGIEPENLEIIAPHVGGGFGSKGLPHAHVVLAALAAKTTDARPVKYAMTRQQMFAIAGYRTPTRQRVRLAAQQDGRLVAISHEAVEQTSRVKEFQESSADSSGVLYAAENRKVTQRLQHLDVPITTWMRAPGKCPGVHAMELAVDEMAEACGLDPIEFRVLNEPDVDPISGKPFSSRSYVECLREGARQFGWDERAAPGTRREGDWFVGLGVAGATYPTFVFPGSQARIRFEDGTYVVSIGAIDLGTGTWTALTQIAADELAVDYERVRPQFGSTHYPHATVAGGSTGIASWGSAIVSAAREFREQHGENPTEGAEAEGATQRNPDAKKFSQHAFGAHFSEVRVHAYTGEPRVSRMFGVFGAGRIVNPRTARSQFIGGMTMGLSMALHEEGVLDPASGHVVNHDLVGYHVATNADVGSMDATWVEEADPHVNPLGTKGIGEIGIVGAAASVLNAAYNATGIRVRDVPMRPDDLLR